MKKIIYHSVLGTLLTLLFVYFPVYGADKQYNNTVEESFRPTIRILPYEFYESDPAKWIDHKNKVAVNEIDTEKNIEETNECKTNESDSQCYSDNYGKDEMFCQASDDDLSASIRSHDGQSASIREEGIEILKLLKNYVSNPEWRKKNHHNTLFVKIYFFDESGECLPSLDCGLYVSGYENHYNTTDGKVKTVKDVICDNKKGLNSFVNKTHSIDNLSSRIHDNSALNIRRQKIFSNKFDYDVKLYRPRYGS